MEQKPYQVARAAKSLMKMTRLDICETLFNTFPIQSGIDARKLLFFEGLCQLDCDALLKKSFFQTCAPVIEPRV